MDSLCFTKFIEAAFYFYPTGNSNIVRVYVEKGKNAETKACETRNDCQQYELLKRIWNLENLWRLIRARN